MMTFNGTVIVGDLLAEDLIGYQMLSHVTDYDASPCIIVTSLNPDFSMILNKIRLIITEHGSPLAHLSLIAMEYGKTIIRLDQPLEDIPSSGTLSMTGNAQHVQIQIL